MYGLLLLTSLAGLGMGLTLSALANSSEAAIALVPLILIPQIILGGVIMPIQDLSPAMRTLASTMAARWGFEAMLHAEYGDDDLSAMQQECGIPDCVWGVNPATSKFIYYPGDPTKREAAASMAGIAAVGEGLIPAVEPAVSSAVCQAFCVAIQNGHDVTPSTAPSAPAPPTRSARRPTRRLPSSARRSASMRHRARADGRASQPAPACCWAATSSSSSSSSPSSGHETSRSSSR